MEREYLNEREASKLTGRALSTLRNDRSLGRGLPYTKLGRSVRYVKADIISYLDARKIYTTDWKRQGHQQKT